VNLIIDTNIAISALITPASNISRLIFRDLHKSKIIAPHFMFDEILDKYKKIIKITGFSDGQLKELIYLLLKRIDFIDDNLISNKYQREAYELVKDIDKKDLLFVALSLQSGYTIWTGDLKLHKGLSAKGFEKIKTTRELIKII
jgi:predicted nucleic acid-binding protein